MGAAFGEAVRSGRNAYLAGLGRVLAQGAEASSPEAGALTGFLRK
jgi:thiazole synthase